MRFKRRRQQMRTRRGGKSCLAGPSPWRPSLETLERRDLLAVDGGISTPWHNAANPKDVNADNRISPHDALLIINDLLVNGARPVPQGSVEPQSATNGQSGSSNLPKYVDVTGDNVVSPHDLLQVINQLLEPGVVEISVFPTNLAGVPITEIPVDSDFLLQSTVQDVRDPPNPIAGVFSAYLNVSYDSSLATIPQPATFSFDPFFPLAQSFDASTAGFINGAGAASSSLAAPGNAPQNLWTVLVHASAAGVVTFTPSFDTIPGHEVLLYDPTDILTPTNIDFVGASLTITGQPTITVNNVSQFEGDSATTAFVFTVSLSAAHNQTVTVQYNTESPAAPDAATAGVDYQSKSGTLSFAPGATQQIVTVLVNGDIVFENDEIFNFSLSNATNGILGANSVGTGTILNDDILSGLSIADTTVTNVQAGTTDAVFTVSLSQPQAQAVTVEFGTADGTSNGNAIAGVDYTATSGTLTFAPSTITQFVTVSILGNLLPDETESFFVNLTNPSVNAVVQDGSAVGTILPAVPIPNVSIGDVTDTEGDGPGTKDFLFPVTLSSISTEAVRIAFGTSSPATPDAATPDEDYQSTSGTVTFAPGQTLAMVTVVVNGDDVEEPSEVFNMNLSHVAGTIGTLDNSATGTILNDDGPPTILISDTTVNGGTSGTVNAVFTVTLSAPLDTLFTVSYATEDNTAQANVDYLAQSGILSFVPGGALVQTITVPVLGSSVPGPDETFFVNLSSPSPPPDQGGAALGDNQAVGTIVRQGLTISGASIPEGDSGTTFAEFTVKLSQPQDHMVTVAFGTVDDSATSTGPNPDYQATSGTLTFQIGETEMVISVPVIGDMITEPNETFFVDLSDAEGSVIFGGRATGTILNDDGQKVLIQLQLADTSGVPLDPLDPADKLDIGSQFMLQAYVEDIQANPNGILAAYVDVLYTSALITVSGPIVYGPRFPSIQSGSVSTPGLIDEVGGFGPLSPPANPGDPQLLFSILLTATDVGFAEFDVTANNTPTLQTLEYTNDVPILPTLINYVDTSVNIGENVITVDSNSVTEGDTGTTEMVFTATRFVSSGAPATVVYSTSDGTATEGLDYVGQSGTLTFLPGNDTQMVTIEIIGDLTDEHDETFFVNLSDPVGALASVSPGTGTILDDDGPVSVSIANGSGSEGDNVVLTVSLSAESGKTVTVAFNTADSLVDPMATADVDYEPSSGTVTFAPGETQQTISVPAHSDLVIDADEMFRVLLTNPVNTNLGTSSAQGTIIDVPPARITGFVYNDANNNGLKDGEEVGIAGATVRALRDGVVVQTATTANDGSYSLVGLTPGTYSVVELQPGFFVDGRDTRFGVDSPVNDRFDNIVLVPSQLAAGYNFGERTLRPEFVTIFLDKRALFASAVLNRHFGPTTETSHLDLRRGDFWISIDDGWDGPAGIQALFDAGLGSATMTLYNNNVQPVATSLPNADGAELVYSATSGSPYFLRISGTNPDVTLALIDTVSINSVSQFEGIGGMTNFVFTASLSAPQTQTVTVNYSTADGSATTASNDYMALSGMITFAPGETSQMITVAVTGDTTSESDDTFSVLLSSPTNIALGIPAGLGTIKNDDGFSFSGSMLFASNNSGDGTGAAEPATATPASAEPGDDASPQSASPPASDPLAEAPDITAQDDTSNATDAALEEDEDWVGQLLLA